MQPPKMRIATGPASSLFPVPPWHQWPADPPVYRSTLATERYRLFLHITWLATLVPPNIPRRHRDRPLPILRRRIHRTQREQRHIAAAEVAMRLGFAQDTFQTTEKTPRPLWPWRTFHRREG